MSDEQALLRTIIKNPNADTPRLVYADWLDDHTEPPRTCAAPGCVRGTVYKLGTAYDSTHEKCPTCHGTGTVSDGRAELAEFIRVQCELARTPVLESDYPLCVACGGDGLATGPPESRPCRKCDSTGKQDHKRYKHARRLLNRERELLAAHGREWARVPCEKCGGRPDRPEWRCTACQITGDAMMRRGPNNGQAIPRFARGFVERVEVPALSWVMERVEVECGQCDGQGELETGSGMIRECPSCNGTGRLAEPWRVTDWALAVARVHPVQRWECADREPHLNIGGYRWYDEDQHYTLDEDGQRAELPNLVLKAIAARSKFVSFDTPDQARVALARALGDAVRAAVVELWSRDHPTR